MSAGTLVTLQPATRRTGRTAIAAQEVEWIAEVLRGHDIDADVTITNPTAARRPPVQVTLSHANGIRSRALTP